MGFTVVSTGRPVESAPGGRGMKSIRRERSGGRVLRGIAATALAAALCAGSRESAAAVDDVVYNPNNGHFYKFVSGTGTWGSSKTGAEGMANGYLCSLTSSEELQWVLTNVGTGGNSVWIGGHDSVTEGVWTWLSGEPWSYANWNGGEPNNVGGENRLMMYASGTWNDANDVYNLPGYLVEWNSDPNPPPPPVIPTAPTNLTAVLTGAGTIVLEWTDNSANETSFEIERMVEGASFASFVSRNANATTHEDDNIAVSTTYTYRVRAVNGVGPSGWSNEDSATSSAFTPAPASPSDFEAFPSGTDSVDLSWSDNSSGEIGFEVHRRTGTGAFAFLAMRPAEATAFHDTGLVPDADYAYAVRAIGTQRVSGFVQAATSTPPTLLVATVRGDLKDSANFAKDSLKVTASWSFLQGASDGTADPVSEGITIRAGTGDALVVIRLTPGMEGWTERRGKWTWKSPKGTTPRYVVQVDPAAGLVTASVRSMELETPAANPIRVSLGIGDDGGTDFREWTATKKPGVFKLR